MREKLFQEEDIFGAEGANTSIGNTIEETTVKRTTQNIFKVYTKTVTPLLQLDSTGKQRKKYVYEGEVRGEVPFFSANGIRGILRRLLFARQVEVARATGALDKISPELFYFYAQGASLGKFPLMDYITPLSEDMVRKNAPVISLFGAGLSGVEGKLAVTDLEPAGDFEKFRYGTTKEGEEFIYSPLIQNIEGFRTDAIKNKLFMKPLGTKYSEIEKWAEEYALLVKEMQGQKGKNEKEAFSNIQMPHEHDMILQGVHLSTSVGNKYGFELTDVEKGALVYAFRELTKMEIGSAKRIGFGLLDWEIRLGDDLLIETTCNPDFVLERNVTVTDKAEQMIEAWEAWLNENASRLTLEEITGAKT